MQIEVNGVHYEIQRKGSGHPLICLHGFSENSSTWDRLEVDGCEQILIDLIGHGKSDKPATLAYYRWNKVINDLHQIIQSLALTSYSILGYSMGGRIALAYALNYPEGIKHLILESASYGENGIYRRWKRRRSDAKLARNILEKGIEWFNDYWSGLGLFYTQKDLPSSIRSEIRERRLSNSPHALANTLRGCGQGVFPCLRGKLSSLTMPTLYIYGEKDKKYGEIGKNFVQANPKISLSIIKDAGHNTHLEKPKEFNRVISAFIHSNSTHFYEQKRD